jgi:2-succinyl-5-enolpyruvyl-6-hydroxy-3-cyclohexene-1-carboxylate synthase
VLVETLVRCGLRQAVVSPGSRSTPLTLAFAAHPSIECLPVLDERSAGFFALGLGKQHGRPVALVCTSGTAAANYFPAIIEARESGVPLLVLTADRPPEMRACSSGQTIDQQKLYGSHVVFYHELAVPEPSLPRLRYLRQTLQHAYLNTLRPLAGPVHLNCPFRDPLHPVREEGMEGLRALVESEGFWAHLEAPLFCETRLGQWPLPHTGKGLIIAGPSADMSATRARQLGELSRKLGWPLLADALSPLRHHSVEVPALVSHYDAILRSSGLAQRLAPEAVLVIDALPTSKLLRAWLDSLAGVPLLFVSSSGENRDATHGSGRQVDVDLGTLLDLLGDEQPEHGDFAANWATAEKAAGRSIAEALSADQELFETKATWLLSQRLPADTPLFVANSMPVRDLEYVWECGDRRTHVFFNRGANGIDGTLSCALGVTHRNHPGLLLTGDLSLLHDSNGFLIGPKYKGSLTIVLINNQGGGIFEHLPVAQQKDCFEEYFATPQKMDFAQLAKAHGIAHVAIESWEQFVSEISNLPESGIRLLELRTDRKRDCARRRQLFADAQAAAEHALGVGSAAIPELKR